MNGTVIYIPVYAINTSAEGPDLDDVIYLWRFVHVLCLYACRFHHFLTI